MIDASSPEFVFMVLLGVAAGVLALLAVFQRARLRRLQSEIAEAAKLRTDLAAMTERASRLPELDEKLASLASERDEWREKALAARSTLEAERKAHDARLQELRDARKEMEDRFSKLASGALKDNAESFLKLVSERFEKHNQAAREDLEKRQTAISSLLRPLDEKLGRFDLRIQEIEKARQEAYGAIQQQVRLLTEGQQTLGNETRKLVQALRAPKSRGRWGELQLQQVFEMAGMAEHVDYLREYHMDTDEGARRPDAIVRIPGGKSIVVDAKTPLAAYLDAIDSETPEEQTAHLQRHARQVREHVRKLASKAYQSNLESTPDFVVMFIPGETFVSAAVEHDPELIEYAFGMKVLIATPTTLMALVKAIAYGWQQEKMAENALEVQKAAKELYDRLGKFAEHLGRTGRSLRQSVEHFNDAVGSLERRVLPSARKFETMGVVPAQSSLAAPAMVESEPRRLAARELAGNASGGSDGPRGLIEGEDDSA